MPNPQTSSMLSGFPPVLNAATRVLILGSFPGVASLAVQQYYAHPRNQFWDLVSIVTGVELRPLPYEKKIEALLSRGVGLWDVLAKAERAGSLDASIRNEIHNPLLDMVDDLPQLRAIGFNGGTAARHGRRQLGNTRHEPALIDLPSSSPAYTLNFQEKCLAWAPLGKYLGIQAYIE